MKLLLLAVLICSGCTTVSTQPPAGSKTYSCTVTDYEQAVSIRCLKAKPEK